MLNYVRNIKIKESYIYYFLVFWVYGFYGAGTDSNTNFKYFNLFFPILLFLIVIFFDKKNNNLIEIKKYFLFFQLRKNIKYYFILFISLFYLSYEKITISISGDEYAYVGLGLIHSNLIIKKFSGFFTLIHEWEIKYLYQIISIILIFCIFIYAVISAYLLSKYKLINLLIFSLIILSLRYLITSYGGNQFPHPPLIGLPSFVSVSFFGLSDITLKFSYFFIYLIFSFYIFVKLSKNFNKLLVLLITISLFSLPGILYLGISYEQALISMICFSIVLIEVIKKKEINYKNIFIVILFFSFFRILALLSLSIIFFYIIFKSKSLKEFRNEIFISIKNSYPLLLIIPFLLFSFINKSSLSIERLGFDFFTINFFVNDLTQMIFNSFSLYLGILIYLIIFYCIFIKSKILIFFIITLLIVYSDVLSNNSKYLYEIFFPILLYFVLNLNYLVKIYYFRNIFIFIIVALIPINFIYLKNFSNICIENDMALNQNNKYEVNFGCSFHNNNPVDLKQSYKYLKNTKSFSFKNLYVPGVYYGILPSVINGMKIKEYNQHIKINQNQNALNIKNNIDWISADSKLIHSDTRISQVLLGDLANSDIIIKGLVKLGWEIINIKYNDNFKTRTYIIQRNN